jgi:hypothetical protein
MTPNPLRCDEAREMSTAPRPDPDAGRDSQRRPRFTMWCQAPPAELFTHKLTLLRRLTRQPLTRQMCQLRCQESDTGG